MPVAIAGMHRSGTSMVTRLLNLCGLYLGTEEDLLPATKDNLEGYWENTKFLKINDEILASFGGGWDLPPVFDIGWEVSPYLAPISQHARQVIGEIPSEPVWGWKDPRNSITLPFWKTLLPNLKTIICIRNPFEVYTSLVRRGSASTNFSYNLWLTYTQQLIASTKPEERIITHYDSFFRNPQSELRRLANFVELEVSDETINLACRTILIDMRHNHGSINDLRATNPPDKLLNLYRQLCQQAGRVYAISLSPGEDEFLQHIAPTEELISTPLEKDMKGLIQDLEIANGEKLRLQQEIVRLREEKTALQNAIKDIFSSRSWRLVQILQKFRLFFVSLGSSQKKTLKGIRSLFVHNNKIHILAAPNSKKNVSTKVICLHHRLGGLTSHHFNEAHGFMQEFARREKEFLLLVSIHAPAQLVAALHARAVLDDSTFRTEWSFAERSRRFLDMLHAQVDADLNANDCVLITISTQLEAHALTCWLQELPRDKKPWITILILSDRWNRSGRDEYERQIAEFRILKDAISKLPFEDRNRLIFCTLTKLLAEELTDLLGINVDVAPIPLEYGDPALYRSIKPNSHLPRVVMLGGTRREKGSYLMPDIVRACRSHVQVEFLVHLANNSLTVEETEKLAHIAEEPYVTVIREPMTLPEYNTALNSADIAVFPYETIPYRKRNSGVFAEAVAYGKPVVAPRGTWMAEQIAAGHAAGVIVEDLQPESIAQAIARCVADLKPLQQLAQALSIEWRKTTGLSVFVDFMEEQIALRKKALPDLLSQTPDCSFILSVEQGKLESQAVLLVESLRQFGGIYADCPVYAISPRPSRRIGAACLESLTALGVQVIVEELILPDEAYGTVARLAACAWAERNLASEIIVSLDNDLFFVDEPDFSLEGADFFARPVDVKGMCTSGSGDPFDVYWRKIAQATGVDYDEIPWVETTVDRVSVKASYNGGMVAVRRQLGLFQRAEEMFRILRDNGLSPHQSGAQQVFASTGFVGEEASRWWGSSQAVLSMAATQLKAVISIAPPTYNIPVHLAQFAETLRNRIDLKDSVLIHYHWLLDKEYVSKDTIFYGSSALPPSILQWLKNKTPLGETHVT